MSTRDTRSHPPASLHRLLSVKFNIGLLLLAIFFVGVVLIGFAQRFIDG